MKFEDWVEKKRGKTARTQFLRTFADQSGVSLQTLQSVAKGGRMSLYAKAQAISDATKGEVSIKDLCE